MLSVKDMTDSGFDYNNCKYINEEDYRYLVASGCKPRIDDVLVAKDGSYLKTSFVQTEDVEQAILSSIAILTPNTGIINPSYLSLFFKASHTKEIVEKHYLTGTAIKRIILRGFKQLRIPVPSLAEQERIVSELDLLTGIIDKQKQQLKELDNLAQSVFYDMFGDPIENDKKWDTVLLKNAVQEMFLGPFGSALKTDCYVPKEDSFCMVYEQKHAIRKTMNVEAHFIDKMKYDALRRFEVHSGDFIMSCRGTIGEIYRIPSGAPIGIIHPSLMKIRLNENVYNPAFFLCLLTRLIKNENTNGNCVQMAITAKELGQRTPILPPMGLQESFAKKIEAIESQKESINRSIAESQKLFDYTMDKYFG